MSKFTIKLFSSKTCPHCLVTKNIINSQVLPKYDIELIILDIHQNLDEAKEYGFSGSSAPFTVLLKGVDPIYTTGMIRLQEFIKILDQYND